MVADRKPVRVPLPRGNTILNLALIPRMGGLSVILATPLSYFAETFSRVLFSSTPRRTALELFAPFSTHGTGA